MRPPVMNPSVVSTRRVGTGKSVRMPPRNRRHPVDRSLGVRLHRLIAAGTQHRGVRDVIGATRHHDDAVRRSQDPLEIDGPMLTHPVLEDAAHAAWQELFCDVHERVPGLVRSRDSLELATSGSDGEEHATADVIPRHVALSPTSSGCLGEFVAPTSSSRPTSSASSVSRGSSTFHTLVGRQDRAG